MSGKGENVGGQHFGIGNGNLDDKNGKASGGLLNIIWTTIMNMIML